MSHNIAGKMVYSYMQPMWHAITEPSQVQQTAEEIMTERFEGGYVMETRPVTVTLNGEQVETGDFAVVRGVANFDPKEQVFGYCTERYHPLQPMDVCRSFDVNVNQHVETMAVLGAGEQMFITWKLPSIQVVKDDVDLYGVVRTGFDTMKGTKLFTSGVRVVCQNTFTLAENWAKQHTDRSTNRGEVWQGKGVNKNLLRDLGYWMKHVQESAIHQANLMENLFSNLASTPITSDAEAWKILNEAYPDADNVSEYYPKELRNTKEETTLEFNLKQQGIRDGIYQLFAGAGTAITPDYWGMFNSATEYFCHVMPSKRPIAESVMFGGRQKLTTQILKVLSNNTYYKS